MKWVKIILYILILIAEEIDKTDAISAASNKFQISEKDIKNNCNI